MGIGDFARRLESFRKDLPNTHHEYNKRIGRYFVEEAKPRTPMDTGLSRESWWFGHCPEEVTVRNTAEDPRRPGNFYASFWNNGTRSQTGTHTMQIVANMVNRRKREIFDEELRKAWENA